MSAFRQYSAYYDLLYADKEYAAEAAYVARRLRSADPAVRKVLELGSGTGRHGRLLAGLGFGVHGVERSPEMAAQASRGVARVGGEGSFSCEVGDLRSYRAGRGFDAVISLFHVISYQTTDDDLGAAFQTAAAHLRPSGLFLFDVWHGPAVLAQRPEARTKAVADASRRVRRTARPILDQASATVRVNYEMDCEDLCGGDRIRFGEEHLLRYLFPDEIVRLAADAGFDIVHSEEFLTGAAPSTATWGVAYLARKAALTA
jgi:SAM-dependent methyltransferase